MFTLASAAESVFTYCSIIVTLDTAFKVGYGCDSGIKNSSALDLPTLPSNLLLIFSSLLSLSANSLTVETIQNFKVHLSCRLFLSSFVSRSRPVGVNVLARLPIPPTATLPSPSCLCLWSLRIFPSLPGSHLIKTF